MASIRKRILPSGRSAWLVDFTDATGRRRAQQFSTKREADAFMVSARAEVARGIYVHDSDALTVGAAATLWLGRCELRCRSNRRMERATLRDYEGKLRLHILDPVIGVGSMKLSRLTRKAVGDFRNRLLACNRSEAQTRKILSVLSLIVSQAQEDGLIPHNPVQGVRVIHAGRVRETISVPQKEEMRRLIEAATDHFRVALVVSALCGLRASELRGLRWVDIDLKAHLIHVRQRADAFNAFGDPKSAAGRRSVPMGPLVTNLLKQWKLACPPSPFDLVFPSKRGTVQGHSNILKRHFKPLCRELGITLRWHDLRHFAVSLWIEQGFSVKEVMTFAGHSSAQMTMDRYGHLFPSPDHQRAMAAVEQRLFTSMRYTDATS